MNLKKALLTIVCINITTALILSLLSIWGCTVLLSQVATDGTTAYIHSGSVSITRAPETANQVIAAAEIISIIQIILPILIYILALFSTASMFYRLKLKEPLAVLASGASRIIGNDLDFTIETKSRDELGQLCTAFEIMRKTLLENNRKLWRQAEERKRLNAAFSHNLRNPVTVLKGSVKLAKKSVENKTVNPGQIAGHLSLIEHYTGRMERYIEIMSSIQKLEDIPVEQECIPWDALVSELEHTIYLLGENSGKHLNFCASGYPKPVFIDKSILFQIAENLISNALRFAEQNISVTCSVTGGRLELSVTDDGCGFPTTLIQNGIQPFQKGKEDAEHFGIGLYICSLLCEKHGGGISVRNNKIGATVSAAVTI
ncbi:MAG: HAMP domain-containing histidine kinase [Eubacterium sp.]|nr:HAMP domain-containing histidine kinase [Eubacterium sp.]